MQCYLSIAQIARWTKRFHGVITTAWNLVICTDFKDHSPNHIAFLSTALAYKGQTARYQSSRTFPTGRDVFRKNCKYSCGYLHAWSTNPKEARIAYIYPGGKVAPSRFSSWYHLYLLRPRPEGLLHSARLFFVPLLS